MRLNTKKGDKKPSSTASILSNRRGNDSSKKQQQQHQQRGSSATTTAPPIKPKGKKKTTFASSNKTPAPPPKESALKNTTSSYDGNEEENNNEFVTDGTSTTFSSPFSQLELRDIQESFTTFDIDGSGQIVVGELREVLQSLQIEQAQSSLNIVVYPYLDQVVAELESAYGDDDTMDINEYLQLMERTTLQHRMLSSLEASGSGSNDEDDSNNAKENNNYAYVFSLFDIDNKGYITVDDLERVAMYLGEQDMTREELAEMIDRGRTSSGTGGGEADSEDDEGGGGAGDGRVTLAQFTNIMTTKLYRLSGSDSTNNSSDSQDGEDEQQNDEAAT